MQKVVIGKIVKPQGLKGEVKVLLTTNETNFVKNLKSLFIGENDIPVKIEKSYFVGKFVVFKFAGFSSFEQADKLRNLSVLADRKDFTIEKDTFLIGDILGSMVYDENNNEIGRLLNVEQYGAADVFVVFADGRQYSFPFVKDVVKKVYPEQKIIVVNKEKFDEVKICE